MVGDFVASCSLGLILIWIGMFCTGATGATAVDLLEHMQGRIWGFGWEHWVWGLGVIQSQGVAPVKRFALVPLGPSLLSYSSTCKVGQKLASTGFRR